MRLTEPIRQEHQELLPEIDKLRQAAVAVGQLPDDELTPLIDANIAFLRHHLIPHAMMEDEVLYQVVASVMGAPEATKTMSRDHTAVVELTDRLERLRLNLQDIDSLREVLYGLYALVTVHFAKEEEIYLPLLDERLTREEADDMFARMQHVHGSHH